MDTGTTFEIAGVSIRKDSGNWLLSSPDEVDLTPNAVSQLVLVLKLIQEDLQA